jgi:hypothetical protein
MARIEIDDALAAPTADEAARASALSLGRAAAAWIVAAALIVVSVIGALVYGRSRSTESRSIVRASMPLVEPLDPRSAAAIVRRVARWHARRLPHRRRGPLRSRLLHEAVSSASVGTKGRLVPSFSPDGEWLAFFVGNTLKKVSLVSGAVVTIAELPSYRPSGLPRWHLGRRGHDRLSSATGAGIFGVGQRGGEPRPLATIAPAAGEMGHRWPQIMARSLDTKNSMPWRRGTPRCICRPGTLSIHAQAPCTRRRSMRSGSPSAAHP